MSIVTCIVAFPLLAALLLAFVPRNYRVIMQFVAIAATFISLLLAIKMFCQFDHAGADAHGYRFSATVPGLGSDTLGIACKFGVDGVNVGLLLMGAIVAFAAACCSWEIREREKEFYILLLLMSGGILGAFASLDLLFFYFFHELALVPTFIMIGVWGRGQNRNYAAYNITLYLNLGALITLIGLIMLYAKAGATTFDIGELTNRLRATPLSTHDQNTIFPWLLLGFGILISLWPFHTWAPLGYGAAPAPTAMLHAGVLKKFGLYGLIRIALPLLPQASAQWAHIIAWLCLGNLFYCGLVALRQKNLNWLVGYSSVAHMGFIFLGIASLNLIGVTGAVLVMIAHGLLAALTFGLNGFIYSRTGTLDMPELGGLLRKIPFIGALLIMAIFAGCGLPGFANFAGEVSVFFGAWRSYHVITTLAVWAALVIGAVYMLRAIRSVLHGPLNDRWAGIVESSWLQRIPYLLLLGALILFGFFPQLLVDKIKPGVEQVLNQTPAPTERASADEDSWIVQVKP